MSGPLVYNHENPHSLLIVSAGKTPPTCDEIVDLRHSACGHNNAQFEELGVIDGRWLHLAAWGRVRSGVGSTVYLL